ncbi:MAG: hypothetical protein OTJ97_03090, partial [SAR202 cluster bacterium]|nr:hypothetical protein [SAR202 cluster bacterium]
MAMSRPDQIPLSEERASDRPASPSQTQRTTLLHRTLRRGAAFLGMTSGAEYRLTQPDCPTVLAPGNPSAQRDPLSNLIEVGIVLQTDVSNARVGNHEWKSSKIPGIVRVQALPDTGCTVGEHFDGHSMISRPLAEYLG